MKNSADILIKNGLIFDGGLAGPYISDIGITGDRITFVGGPGTVAATVIDAQGLAVAPGFIDTHAHSDFTLMADPRAEGKICQGITTEINGNCGMSAAPLYGKTVERREEDLRELGIKERWNTLGEYFSLLEKKGFAPNIAMLAGHGNLRGSVVGYDDRRPSDEDLSKMARLLKDALAQGAIGLSTGLIYPPGIYSDTEELVGLILAARGNEFIYASHIRSEGQRLEEAVEEVIRIGRQTGAKVHISHIKTAGQQNWQKAESVITLLNEAAGSGVRVSCDRYPYIASGTDLDTLLPQWAFLGGNEEELRRLQREEDRQLMAKEIREQASSPDYWDKVIISSVATESHRWMEGMTISGISRKLRMDEIEALFRILTEERLRVGAIFQSMSEANLGKFLSLPYCTIGSDSSARSFDGPTATGKPHPRTFGTFPRLFAEYVRQGKLLSLSEAVHKATMLAAVTFGLEGRGRIQKGMYADIVVFNPEKIADRATFEDPFRRPDGIAYVLVNGVPAIWEGSTTGRLAGRVLRGGQLHSQS